MSTTTHCELCERHATEKPSWEPGPWIDEPDHLLWEHAGLPCIVHRGGSGALCGYVGVPPGHPLHGKDYGERESVADLDVHGGLTYAAPCQGHICHTPKPGEPEDLFWLGFDCGHAFDVSPRYLGLTSEQPSCKMSPPDFEKHYWNLSEVKAETERLAEQLAAVGVSP